MVTCATSIFLTGAGFFIGGVFFISSKIGLTSFVAPLSETALENLNRVELFSKEKAQTMNYELCIYHDKDDYSKEYINLTKDFYLGL